MAEAKTEHWFLAIAAHKVVVYIISFAFGAVFVSIANTDVNVGYWMRANLSALYFTCVAIAIVVAPLRQLNKFPLDENKWYHRLWLFFVLGISQGFAFCQLLATEIRAHPEIFS